MYKLQFIKTSKFLLRFIIGLIVFSCQSTIPNQKYFGDMDKYLNKIHEINIQNSNIKKSFLLVNLNCLDCLGRENIKKLETLTNKDLNFIFIGKTFEPEILAIIQNIKSKNAVFEDVDNKAFLYELNFSKVILLKIDNSEITKYKVYHGLNINMIQEDL